MTSNSESIIDMNCLQDLSTEDLKNLLSRVELEVKKRATAETKMEPCTPVVTPNHKKRVKDSDLVNFARDCLQKAGASKDSAMSAAEVLVCADRRGVTSHGVNRLYLYCSELQT